MTTNEIDFLKELNRATDIVYANEPERVLAMENALVVIKTEILDRLEELEVDKDLELASYAPKV